MALKEAGCRRVYEEKISGAKRNRSRLARLVDRLRERNVVVVHHLDRLAHAKRDLLELAEPLRATPASAGRTWADTTSPSGARCSLSSPASPSSSKRWVHRRTSTDWTAAVQHGAPTGPLVPPGA